MNFGKMPFGKWYNYKSIIVVYISSAAWVLEFVPPKVNSMVLIFFAQLLNG